MTMERIYHKLHLLFTMTACVLCTSDGRNCYSCANATHVSECTSIITCDKDEVCFSDHNHTSDGIVYSFGCRLEQECSALIQNGDSSILGSLVSQSGVTGPCSECCKEQLCNKQLCQQTYKECADGTEIPCASLGAMVDICSDTDKASVICRRFCGLCNYVHGQWSSWVTSPCDVTCGSGTQTKTRSCTAPVPSGGGQNCTGPSESTGACIQELCPIEGEWSSWQPSKCDVTCGSGKLTRVRNCIAPASSASSPSGRYKCTGPSKDIQPCIQEPCPTNVSWTDWTPWSDCSSSCGIGLKRRQRTCSFQEAEKNDDSCLGDPREIQVCLNQECAVTHGGWGSWSPWTSCTASCNGELSTRQRNCDNPKPSADGDFCNGSPSEVKLCNQQKCSGRNASFLANDVYKGSNGILRFRNVSLNEGSFFNMTTGVFSCGFPGIYHFSANIIEAGSGDFKIMCYIRRNHTHLVSMNFVQSPLESVYFMYGFRSATAAATVQLFKGDIIYISCDRSRETSLQESSFTGFLVRDNSD